MNLNQVNPDQASPVRTFSLPVARRVTAVLALLLGSGYVINAWQNLSFGRWHRPGAAIFPIAVGVILALSAVAIWLERSDDDGEPQRFSLPSGADLTRLLSVMGTFALYLLAMPYIGNMIASALFLLAAMRILSDAPLWRIAVYAAIIAVSFEVFFVKLLQVQMPAGFMRVF